MRRFGLSQRVILGSILLFLLVTLVMGMTWYRLSRLVEATTHLRGSDDVIVMGSQVQDDLLYLLQTQEFFDQYLSVQTWKHYFELSQRVNKLLNRARSARIYQRAENELESLDKARREMSNVLENATYSLDPNFPVGAVSPDTLKKIRESRSRLHQQISALMVKERENRQSLEELLHEQLDSIMETTFWVAVAVLLAGCTFAFYLHRAAVTPIKNLSATMREAERELTEVVPPPGAAPEMQELVESFNRMTTSLNRHQKRISSMLSLAVTVAHEVRNPIAAIGTAIQAIEKSYPADGADREIFAEILKEVHRVNSIISDLLVFARPRPVQAEYFRISELVQELQILMHPFLEGKKIGFSCDIPADLDEIEADRNQMHRLLLNLLTNASDAIGDSGQMKIVVESHSDSMIRLVVEDSGPGVPESDREKVFYPFFTTRAKGTGLGLSIVSDIVERHHGQIRVTDGKLFSGARFEIEMPRRFVADEAAPDQERSERSRS
ncbi:MAG TPA: ATP-binding protein [Candidatus Ozemobacteraceae bacterium]|nr:ATP-binding protein [Candidatus Ozemobacteraceae bacterium]